jgi:hypothetical protein
MSTDQNQNLRIILKKLNIFFVESDQIIHTVWKRQNSNDVDIAISCNGEIVNAISMINEKKIKDPEFANNFFQFNLKYPFFKIGLDKKQRFLIIWQYPIVCLNEGILKNSFNIFLNFFDSIYS